MIKQVIFICGVRRILLHYEISLLHTSGARDFLYFALCRGGKFICAYSPEVGKSGTNRENCLKVHLQFSQATVKIFSKYSPHKLSKIFKEIFY